MSGFRSGKRMFLTEHTGFKDSWLVLWLQHLGARVSGYALAPPPATPRLLEIARVGTGRASILDDVTNYDHLVSTLRSATPDIVIHMAAQSLVLYSYANPDRPYRTNVLGTVHLLQSFRQVNSVRAVLNITYGRCYENRESISAYRESDRLAAAIPIARARPVLKLCPRPSVTLPFRPAGMWATLWRWPLHLPATWHGGDWAKDRTSDDRSHVPRTNCAQATI
ncbi:GDP-mannose 4,6-dehydratase [Bradyrhizobium sp. BR 1432]|uniref:GDP-mannose 4,6-dehydratase n=1 Tax=Bradyrhizobium sp. BR 1432 TaxID=3447966 RepID=UPI003EE66C4E